VRVFGWCSIDREAYGLQKSFVEKRGGREVGLYVSDTEMETLVVDWDEITENPPSTNPYARGLSCAMRHTPL
jgi:hypothetical protein